MSKKEIKSKARYLNMMLKLALLLLGPDRYRALMKYLAHISVIRNQDFLLL